MRKIRIMKFVSVIIIICVFPIDHSGECLQNINIFFIFFSYLMS